MNNARLTFVHALSPLHAGTGQGAGVIDLPIAREKATGLPFLPGSSLKGTLRAHCNANVSAEDCKHLFGPDTTEIQSDSNHSSSVQFSDQRLLLLPVRSLAGTFAWVTSPYVLRRFARDIEDTQITPPEGAIPAIQKEETCFVTSDVSKIKVNTSVYLEEFELNTLPEEGVKGGVNAWAKWLGTCVFPQDPVWQQMLIERFCIVHDDVFSFLLDTATEITARIKLEDTKTVQDGGLWYEEALPTETILSGIVLATPVKAVKITTDRVFEVLSGIMEKTLQLGGKATVGRGMCRVQLAGEAKQAILEEGSTGNANT